MFVPSAPPRAPAALTPAAIVPTISGFAAVPNRRYDFGFHLSFNRRYDFRFHLSFNRRYNLSFRRSCRRNFSSPRRTVSHRRAERLSNRHGLIATSVRRFEQRHRCEGALQSDVAPQPDVDSQPEVALQPPRRPRRCFRFSAANGAQIHQRASIGDVQTIVPARQLACSILYLNETHIPINDASCFEGE
jgi:hypothetical protein